MQGWVSLPSRFGQLTEVLFDEYPVYTYSIPSDVIERHLPDRLQAFTSVTWKNLAKRYFFYSKPIIVASRSQMSADQQSLPRSSSLEALLVYLLEGTERNTRFNFVLTGNALIIVRLPRTRHLSYHLLCKHITLANRSTDVRFAGELLRDESDRFRLNNNSGTYQPTDRLLRPMTRLLRTLAPHLPFNGVSFQLTVQPPLKQRIGQKLKQRLHPLPLLS